MHTLLTDEQWAVVEPLVSRPRARTGRPPRDARILFEAACWILTTGSQWRALPKEFGPWQTAFDRFNRWRREGVFDRLVAELQRRSNEEGLIDWTLFCLDGTSVRACRAAAGAGDGGTRTSRRATRWAAPAGGSPARSTSSPTGRATCCRSRSRRGSGTSRRRSRRCSVR